MQFKLERHAQLMGLMYGVEGMHSTEWNNKIVLFTRIIWKIAHTYTRIWDLQICWYLNLFCTKQYIILCDNVSGTSML